MRAYSSLRQLEAKGICVDEYLTNERDGVFKARLDCKRWGKKRNILAYFTFEDGSKVMASAWQNTGYLGIPEIEEGARLMLTFERAKNGTTLMPSFTEKHIEGIHKFVFFFGQYFSCRLGLCLYYRYVPQAFCYSFPYYLS